MVVRRSGSRRRRVVIDEVANRSEGRTTPASSSPAKTTRKKNDADASPGDSRLYTFGAGRRGQRKTTDFVPKRVLPFSFVVLVLVVIAAAINALAVYAPSWEPTIGAEGMRMLSLTGIGSLGNWFASAMFILAGVTCLQVFALRKHRCDDYRGTYRIWFWLSGAMFLSSLHFAVDFGSVGKNVLESITQQSFYDKIWLVVTFKLVLLALIGVRAAFEIKESRGTLVVASFAWLGFVLASLLPVPVVKESLTMVDYGTVYGNVVLFATVGLLLANLTYARFVFLQANGLIKPRVIKEKVAKAKAKPKSKKTTQTSSRVKKAKTSEDTVEEEVEEPVVEAAPKRTSKKKATKLKVAVPEEAPEVPKPEAKTRPPVPKPSRPPVPKPTKVSNKKKAAMDESEVQEILSITPEQYANMSKSERRRHRKLEKRMKRAA